MSVRNFGNPPQFSTTAATASDPSTATLVAELILSSAGIKVDDTYEVRYTAGASTGAAWRLEHAISSGLGSTAITTQIVVFTGSNQSAEYVYTHRASPGDRFRIVPLSSFTGTAAAKIQIEAIT